MDNFENVGLLGFMCFGLKIPNNKFQAPKKHRFEIQSPNALNFGHCNLFEAWNFELVILAWCLSQWSRPNFELSPEHYSFGACLFEYVQQNAPAKLKIWPDFRTL